jgi:hypothetical protein
MTQMAFLVDENVMLHASFKRCRNQKQRVKYKDYLIECIIELFVRILVK